MNRTAAILLSAGESTRMGQPKALLRWGSRSLIRYQIDSLMDAGVEHTIVVLGADYWVPQAHVPIVKDITTVVNTEYKDGKTTSIKCGVMAIRPEFNSLVILSVDQPRPSWIISELIISHNQSNQQITQPVARGRKGHPVIFDTSLIPELLEINEMTQGIRSIIHRHRSLTNLVAMESSIVTIDINDPDTYAEAHYLFFNH